jgi:hypothetical protein
MNQNQILQQTLMDQLKRLNECGENPIKLEREVMRANAIAQVSNSIINSAKMELQFMKQTETKHSTFYTEAISDEVKEEHNNYITDFVETKEETIPVKVNKPTQKQLHAAKMDAELLQDKKAVKGDDLKGKKPVVINAKTTIWVDQNKDEDQAREEWIAKHPVLNL